LLRFPLGRLLSLAEFSKIQPKPGVFYAKCATLKIGFFGKVAPHGFLDQFENWSGVFPLPLVATWLP